MVKERNLTRWIFVLPAMIIVGLLFVYPFFSSIFYSFTNKHLIMLIINLLVWLTIKLCYQIPTSLMRSLIQLSGPFSH